MAVSARRSSSRKTRVFRSYDEYARYYNRQDGDDTDITTLGRKWAIETMAIFKKAAKKASKKASAGRRRGSR